MTTFLLICLIGYVILQQHNINRKVNTILMKQDEAVAELAKVSAAMDKIGKETAQLLVDIQALKDAAANAGDVNPALQAAIEKVASQATTVDDLVPDAPEL